MARRRKITRKSFSNVGNKLFPFVKAVSAPIAFLEQLTAKDRQINAGTLSTATTTTQAKMLLNFVTGRLAGFGLFKNTGAITPPQTINPAGVINKWTNAGLIGIAYKVLGGSINKMSKEVYKYSWDTLKNAHAYKGNVHPWGGGGGQAFIIQPDEIVSEP